VTFRQGVHQYPAWSPDGKQLAYAAEAGGVRKIFRKRAEAPDETRLTSGAYDDLQPTWSPAGSTILFVRAQRPNVRLEPGDVFGEYDGVTSGRSTSARTGGQLLENAFDPSYSPDGARIAVDASWGAPAASGGGPPGHNPQQVTADTSEAVSHVRPHWSPDGTRIVFQSIERTNFNIRVVDVASRKTVWVTTALFHDLNPVWAPSGRFIYFSSDRGGGLNLWRVPVASDGTPRDLPQQLTNGGGQDVDAAISPTARAWRSPF